MPLRNLQAVTRSPSLTRGCALLVLTRLPARPSTSFIPSNATGSPTGKAASQPPFPTSSYFRSIFLMRDQAYTTGPDAQAEAACQTLREGIAAIYAIMNPTTETLFPRLVASARLLKEHLHAYTFSPDAAVYDEDAVIAIEEAERLLSQATRVVGRREKPQGHSDEDICSDCHCTRSDAEESEGWNPEACSCFSCAESVFQLAEKFGISAEGVREADALHKLDILRANLWHFRRHHKQAEIEACLTFRK